MLAQLQGFLRAPSHKNLRSTENDGSEPEFIPHCELHRLKIAPLKVCGSRQQVIAPAILLPQSPSHSVFEWRLPRCGGPSAGLCGLPAAIRPPQPHGHSATLPAEGRSMRPPGRRAATAPLAGAPLPDEALFPAPPRWGSHPPWLRASSENLHPLKEKD